MNRTQRMMLMLVSLFAMLGTACSPTLTVKLTRENTPTAPNTSDLEDRYGKATGLLYAETTDGGRMMLCTVTAFEHGGRTYRFVTASHCVSEDDTAHERAGIVSTNWYITLDEGGNKKFYPAKVIAAGYQSRGDDFAVLETELDHDVPVMTVANDDPRLGEDVCNFASPVGLGKQLFRGHVSMEYLDRPVVGEGINWRGATLIQTSVGPGSSGSSVVSESRGQIVAFIVGEISARRGSPNVVAIPVTKFRLFWGGVQAGMYRWYQPAETVTPAPTADALKNLWKRIHITGITYQLPDEPASDSPPAPKPPSATVPPEPPPAVPPPATSPPPAAAPPAPPSPAESK